MNIKKTLAASALAGAMTVTAAAVPASATENGNGNGNGNGHKHITKVYKAQKSVLQNTQQNVQVADVDQDASADGGEAIAANLGNTNLALGINTLTFGSENTTAAEQNNVAVADASGGEASNSATVNQAAANLAKLGSFNWG